MPITRIDHVALPITNGEEVFEFYKHLGVEILHEEDWLADKVDKCGIQFGTDNKINVRPKKREVREALAAQAAEESKPPGIESNGHVCLEWEGGIDSLIDRLAEGGTPHKLGPAPRIGGREGGYARGVSVYVFDPDGKWLEFISYAPADLAKYPGQTPEERYAEKMAAAAAS